MSDTVSSLETKKGKNLSGKKFIFIIAVVAVASLILGFVLSRFVVSPEEIAAKTKPPSAGFIKVPVEKRIVQSTLNTRAEIAYSDSVAIDITASETAGGSIVTGAVPKVGDKVDPAKVILEVSGRPVIVLQGQLPMYRSLKSGLSGPDVQQLKEALRAVGIDGGDPSNNVYNAQTAAGVAALYNKVGYSLPGAQDKQGTGSKAVRESEKAVSDAESALNKAQVELNKARNGASTEEKISADNAYNEAERAYSTALAASDQNAVAAAADALKLAKAKRDAVYAAPDVTAQTEAVNTARESLVIARENLEEVRNNALTSLPLSEVVFLDKLPRQVEKVSVSRGQPAGKAALNISSPDIAIISKISAEDAKALKLDNTAEFTTDDGKSVKAKIVEISEILNNENNGENGTASPDSGQQKTQDRGTGRWQVKFQATNIDANELALYQGSNVRMQISLQATNGEVMAVPAAAISAGPSGESRVQVALSKAKNAKTKMVEIRTKLSADGYVEIEPLKKAALNIGDLVVVGK